MPASASAPVSTSTHAPVAVTASASSSVDEDPYSEPVEEEKTTDHADPTLSPRACRNRLMPSTSSAHQETSSSTGISTATVKVRPTPVEPSKRATTRDLGVQCCSVTAVPMAGVEMQCPMCGVLYDLDSRSRRKIWVGCTKRECKYWLHADCLLGRSPKITPEFVKEMPFLGPAHK